MVTGPYYSAADAALNGLRLGMSSTPKEEKQMTSPKVNKAAPNLTTAMNPVAGAKRMDFFEALRAIRDGKHIARLEWQNPEHYCLMDDYQLCLHKPDNKICFWIINDSDMAGEDWVVV